MAIQKEKYIRTRKFTLVKINCNSILHPVFSKFYVVSYAIIRINWRSRFEFMRIPEVTHLVLLLMLIFISACQPAPPTDSPQIVLWAWERPENLEFINTSKIAVAFLAQTVELNADAVTVKMRRQPLKVPPETKMIAVTRIETNKKGQKTALSELQRGEILRLLLATLKLKNVSEIQLDFDVTVSEREFYRQLLQELRPQLPTNIGLTITALASWCISDRWMKDLPIDQAVPMAFDMGADDRTIRDFLASGEDWSEPLCRQSYGISINEPLKIDFKPNRTFYLFNSNPNGWKKSDLEHLPNGVKL